MKELPSLLKRLVLVLLLVCSACSTGTDNHLTVYSGREKELVGPSVDLFHKQSGIEVEARYANTAELASTLLEEGGRSPADVYWAQDAGALGAVAAQGLFQNLPDDILSKVPAKYRSRDGLWIGTGARVRVLAYNTDRVQRTELPKSVLDLTDLRWKDRIGWAPANGSFQSFVTALRKTHGDAVALKWLRDMKANGAQVYGENNAIVRAVATGEIDAGLVNHYYVLELGAEDKTIRDHTANHFFENGDVGSLVNVAGVGILKNAKRPENAKRFVRFLLSRTAREYFDEEAYEYPLVSGLRPQPKGVPAIADIKQPRVDLSDLADLRGTLDLLRKAHVL